MLFCQFTRLKVTREMFSLSISHRKPVAFLCFFRLSVTNASYLLIL